MKQGISSTAGNTSKVFISEFTTIWSFAERGSWATHNPNYRGNFAPQVARNVIEMYSDRGETVLDAMCGGGTTLIECKLLGRCGIGVDINPAAVELTKKALEFEHTPLNTPSSLRDTPPLQGESQTKKALRFRHEALGEKTEFRSQKSEDGGGCAAGDLNRSLGCARDDKCGRDARVPSVRVGDARDLGFLGDETVDLILTHPPYLNIIRYSDGIEGDLSAISSVKKFCDEMEIVAGELYRVLKANRYCAIVMGDTRRGRHFVPLAYRVMERFLKAGFILKEDIIKVQHNCSATGRWKWKALKDKFYLIMHEHLFVFRKPAPQEDIARLKESAGGN